MITDIQEFESIRVMVATHKLRFSHHANLIQSGPNQTLMLSVREGEPESFFRIVESGLEIPMSNVSSRIPKGVPLAGKLQKTAGSRLTPKRAAPAKKEPKNVKRKARTEEGDIVVMPRRRAGQTKSIVSPVEGVSDGED